MDVSQFVEAIKSTVERPAVDGCLKQYAAPSGRRPSEDNVQLSEWFNSLSDTDKSMLQKALRDVAHASIFGLFCVLDGVRVIEDPQDRGDMELWHVKNGVRTLINDPDKNMLHDEYNAV